MRKKYEIGLELSKGAKVKELMGALRAAAEPYGQKITVKIVAAPAGAKPEKKPAKAK